MAGPLRLPVEGQLPKQGIRANAKLPERTLCNGRMGNKYIEAVFKLRQQRAYALPEPAFHQIADYCAANLLADRKPDAFLPASGVNQRNISAGCPHSAAVYVAELPVLAQPILLLQSNASLHGVPVPANMEKPVPTLLKSKRWERVAITSYMTAALYSKHFAATTAARSQNAASVLGRHTGTEPVYFAALSLLGLVCTNHLAQLLIRIQYAV